MLFYRGMIYMVNEHIEEAISHLEQAEDQSPMGTGMMIEEIIEELERVKDTFGDDE